MAQKRLGDLTEIVETVRPLVGDRHLLARLATGLVRRVLQAWRLFCLVVGAMAIVLVPRYAFHDPVVAWILGGMGVVLVLVYWPGRNA